jgi:hypothetical protein
MAASTHQNLVSQEEVDAVIQALRADGIDPAIAHRGQIRKAGNVGDRRARTIQTWIRLGNKVKDPGPIEESRLGAEYRTVRGDTMVICLEGTRLSSEDELLDHFDVDRTAWSVAEFTCKNWEMGMKPPATTEYVETKDGRSVPMWVRFESDPVVVPLFSMKALLKRRVSKKEHSDRAYSGYKDWIGWTGEVPAPPPPRPSKEKKIVVINDLHIPFHDERRLMEVVRRTADDTDELVVAGDFADFFNFSRFPKLSQTFTPVEEHQHQQRIANLLSKNFREVKILRGNHDGARMVKMLEAQGVPAAMLDYFQALCPGFINPLELVVKDLKNVSMVDPIELDYARFGFIYQLGDLILSHAETYSRTPLVAAGNALDWLQKFALPEGIVKPFKHVAQAHTHGAGKVWADYGCWAYELGCLCLYPEYVSDPKIKTPRGWKKGFTVFYQHDGVTDSERSNFIPLD